MQACWRSPAKRDRSDSPVRPKAPEARKDMTARPMTVATGTMTGLKIMKSGVAMARTVRVPARVILERARRVTLTGRRVRTVRALVTEERQERQERLDRLLTSPQS